MMLIDDGASFAREAASEMRTQADRLEACAAPQRFGPWTLHFNDLSAGFETIKPAIDDATIGGDRCVYVFELTDVAAIAPLRESVAALKTTASTTFAAAKHNADARDSQTLYVGSSFATHKRRGTLRARLAQHLGLSNLTTYAMHLNQWANALPGGVQITVYQFSTEVDREAVLAIEDYLSSTLDPLLGRRGRAK